MALSAPESAAINSTAKNPAAGPEETGSWNPHYCFEMMYVSPGRSIKDGFLDIPDHMHGAIMYSRSLGFYDPTHGGILRAITDLSDYSPPTYHGHHHKNDH